MFELRLKNFVNTMGRDSSGHCCDGFRTSSGKCSGPCRTRFRVCLKHYQATIDPEQECTFGESTTPVMGNNVVNFETIAFPLDFKWPVRTIFYNGIFEIVKRDSVCVPIPVYTECALISRFSSLPFFQGTFSLIIEAWHENNKSSGRTNNRQKTQ